METVFTADENRAFILEDIILCHDVMDGFPEVSENIVITIFEKHPSLDFRGTSVSLFSRRSE